MALAVVVGFVGLVVSEAAAAAAAGIHRNLEESEPDGTLAELVVPLEGRSQVLEGRS